MSMALWGILDRSEPRSRPDRLGGLLLAAIASNGEATYTSVSTFRVVVGYRLSAALALTSGTMNELLHLAE